MKRLVQKWIASILVTKRDFNVYILGFGFGFLVCGALNDFGFSSEITGAQWNTWTLPREKRQRFLYGPSSVFTQSCRDFEKITNTTPSTPIRPFAVCLELFRRMSLPIISHQYYVGHANEAAMLLKQHLSKAFSLKVVARTFIVFAAPCMVEKGGKTGGQHKNRLNMKGDRKRGTSRTSRYSVVGEKAVARLVSVDTLDDRNKIQVPGPALSSERRRTMQSHWNWRSGKWKNSLVRAWMKK